MNRPLIGVAGLALGLSLLTGAVSASASSAPAPRAPVAYTVGAGLDAGTLYRLAAPSSQSAPQDCASQAPDATDTADSATDTDNVQDPNGPDAAGADSGTEAADSGTLECGDQTTPDAGGEAKFSGVALLAAKTSGASAQAKAQETAPGVESPDGTSETENAADGDQATDGVDCVQQGAQQGDNVGC